MPVADRGTRRGILLEIARRAIGDPEEFSRLVVQRPLYSYQREALRGIVPHIRGSLDDPSFTVMMARQGGKNELSAQLEAWLLNRYRHRGGQIVKAAPTFKPQVVTSQERLKLILNNWWNRNSWKAHFGYIVRLGNAKVLFFSTDRQAKVVGATADLLLELDEAQDIDEVKLSKDFLPMASTSNAAQVDYGTAWTGSTVLAKRMRYNQWLQRRDGICRVWKYPWEIIADQNPAYGKFVEREIRRMGRDHPIIKTQYDLIEISESGDFLNDRQIELMRGYHLRERVRTKDGIYVAGVDFAGESEIEKDELLRILEPRRDSTVVTISRVNWDHATREWPYPRLEVVDHYWWTGQNHATQYQRLVRLLGRQGWDCSVIVCDNQGVGAGVTSFLGDALGRDRVIPYDFNETTKSELGFHFLAAVNTERFKMYAEESPSKEAIEFWKEMGDAQMEVSSLKKIKFFVPEEVGHDDYVTSAALCSFSTEYLPMQPQTEEVDGFLPIPVRGGR